ncbi:TetR/AcrR family transcriptional regulator [Acidisoma cellulosilyticum]|uniref:TetR/AcrR family transcriptional regulator n=1 Tax=Acidisoma cellulosilyticum TaxID=2802395 RepID=UPI001D0B3056|nr:TetR/AcrR family transcriptional regulator [Acidisoma cellulosilyticum]
MTPPAPIRKPRADSQRNREKLLSVAKDAFAAQGPDVSLEEIARRTGVGIGTLYRHFPNRDAIIADVYRREVGQLAGAAAELLDSHPPLDALRAWMRLFVDYIGAKKIMASALNSLAGGTTELYAASGPLITNAIALLLDRCKADGAIRPDAEPMDLMMALVGVAYNTSAGPGWQAAALRVVDILIAGIKQMDSPQAAL